MLTSLQTWKQNVKTEIAELRNAVGFGGPYKYCNNLGKVAGRPHKESCILKVLSVPVDVCPKILNLCCVGSKAY